MFGFGKKKNTKVTAAQLPFTDDRFGIGADALAVYVSMSDLELIRAYAATMQNFTCLNNIILGDCEGEHWDNILHLIETNPEFVAQVENDSDALVPYMDTIERILVFRGVAVADVLGFAREIDDMDENTIEFIFSEYSAAFASPSF